MPVLHEYHNKRGMYVKARYGNRMVTYQLAPAAAAELRRRGMGEGSQLTPDVLHSMVAAGLAYTHGSGAGVVDDPASPPPNGTVTVSVTLSIGVEGSARPSSPKPKKPNRQTPPRSQLPASLPPLQLPSCSSFPGVVCVWCRRSDKLIEHNGRPWCGLCGRWAVQENPVAVSPPPTRPASRPPSSPARREVLAEGKSQLDVAGLLARVWAGVVYEFLGIPVWLWLLMLIGLLVPGLLIASVVGRR